MNISQRSHNNKSNLDATCYEDDDDDDDEFDNADEEE
jgi:hypothetical protein